MTYSRRRPFQGVAGYPGACLVDWVAATFLTGLMHNCHYDEVVVFAVV